MWPCNSNIILTKCAFGLDVYLWLEEMFHVLAHVLCESRFEKLHNLGVCGE